MPTFASVNGGEFLSVFGPQAPHGLIEQSSQRVLGRQAMGRGMAFFDGRHEGGDRTAARAACAG